MSDISIFDVIIYAVSLVVGGATGVVQFFLLYKFVTSVTGGKAGTKTIIFAITQFLFPFAVLVICAFLLPDSIMWVGIGVAVALITCAIIRFVKVSKQKELPKKNKKK